MRFQYPQPQGQELGTPEPFLIVDESDLTLAGIAANTTLAHFMYETRGSDDRPITDLAAAVERPAGNTHSHLQALIYEEGRLDSGPFEAAGRTTSVSNSDPETREFQLDTPTTRDVLEGLWRITRMGGIRKAVERRRYPGVTRDVVAQAKQATSTLA